MQTLHTCPVCGRVLKPFWEYLSKGILDSAPLTLLCGYFCPDPDCTWNDSLSKNEKAIIKGAGE